MDVNTEIGMPTPSTPGVWSVSHQDLQKLGGEEDLSSATIDTGQIVTEVYFCWTVDANSAFVTGEFNNWEVTLPMEKVNTRDGEVWIASKMLPPGSFQYKFIIDNNWRHAEDQPIVYDERGIINNCLTVTIDSCGDSTCFCSSFSLSDPNSPEGVDVEAIESVKPSSAPGMMKAFQNSTGIAYTYVERESQNDVLRSYMHKRINHSPFDVVVVNVHNLKNNERDTLKDGLVSRASSFEDLNRPMRYDPSLAVVRDATYEAALRADEKGSMPHTALATARVYANDPKEFNYSVLARLSSSSLGFNPKDCHGGIELLEKNHYAVRVDPKGLYKTVRSVLPLVENSKSYFEVYITKQEKGGGICVGISTKELPISCLVGTRPNSVGFSTSGNAIQTVHGKEAWSNLGRTVSAGSVVGCLVSLSPVREDGGSEVQAELTFFADGKELGSLSYKFVGGLPLYPTLSLFSREGRVFSLFDVNDMMNAHAVKDEGAVSLDGKSIKAHLERPATQLERSPSQIDRSPAVDS
uniref:B30.2/SPRY domain-containing protein n=2 Tax=Rhodosorus marinus TaxID=101924 RepID=A0A7S0BL98_9RHOD|mmetsp:Transcript_19493/g.28310  ORF Transcript_19493/g.28310 Transcript_19493/m.28310 type:complete len:523 (+) Transcript_19493:547-2115(+)